MTEEIIMKIIDGKLVVPSLGILIMFSVELFTVFKLSFEILGMKVGIRRFWPGILVLLLYNLSGRLILPHLLYGVIFVILLALLLKAAAHKALPWLKACWTAFLDFFIVSLGAVLIQTPLFLHQGIRAIMLHEPLGVALGSLLETLGPLVVLYMIRTSKIPLIPSVGLKATKLDLWGLYLVGALLFVFYSIAVIFMMSLDTASQLFLTVIFILTWFVMLSVLIAYHVIRTLTQKEYEYQYQQHHKERQQYEEELQIQREKTTLLENEKQKLAAINQELQDKTIDPELAARVMLNIAERLEKSANDMLEQQRTYFVSDDHGSPVEIYLTPREKTVMVLLGQARSNKEIAAALKLGEGHIKNVVSQLIEKFRALGVSDRVGLAVVAQKNGMFNADPAQASGNGADEDDDDPGR